MDKKMHIEMHEIPVRDIAEGYLDNAENGVTGYNGRLNIRPAFQREFIYDENQRNEVIRTLRKSFPLNVMYWSKSGKNGQGEDMFELMDGQQRTISICQYVDNGFSVDSLMFDNLNETEKKQILDYKLTIYICDGDEREKLEWFKVINIAGEELEPQELRNAIYTGSWLANAKLRFSKTGCPASGLGGAYMSGKPIRQKYLETAVKWIADRDGITGDDPISEYMARHQHDENAEPLWEYFRSVIKWVETVFPSEPGQKPRKEMNGLPWGLFYNRYSSIFRTSLKEKTDILMKDDEVTSKKGIYEYLLTGNESKLNLRTFSDSEKRTAYEKQRGICVKCRKHFEIDEMHADHITSWSKGGKTVQENCQVLCQRCNATKSNS